MEQRFLALEDQVRRVRRQKSMARVISGSASGAAVLARTPTGGVPAATGDDPWTWGSATCDKIGSDGKLKTGKTYKLYNVVSQVIAESVVVGAVKVGSRYIIVVADCPEGPPTGPVVPGQGQPLTILQPPDGIGIALPLPGLVTFESQIVDLVDGDISGNTQWESSIDGVLGTGSPVQLTVTTEGTHTITARVTNSQGAESTDQISLPVTDSPGGP